MSPRKKAKRRAQKPCPECERLRENHRRVLARREEKIAELDAGLRVRLGLKQRVEQVLSQVVTDYQYQANQIAVLKDRLLGINVDDWILRLNEARATLSALLSQSAPVPPS